MPKFLGYFERVLTQNPAVPRYVGDTLTYVDLSLFQLCEGLRYAFPRATANCDAQYPHLAALASSVRALESAAYLASAAACRSTSPASSGIIPNWTKPATERAQSQPWNSARP